MKEKLEKRCLQEASIFDFYKTESAARSRLYKQRGQEVYGIFECFKVDLHHNNESEKTLFMEKVKNLHVLEREDRREIKRDEVDTLQNIKLEPLNIKQKIRAEQEQKKQDQNQLHRAIGRILSQTSSDGRRTVALQLLKKMQSSSVPLSRDDLLRDFADQLI